MLSNSIRFISNNVKGIQSFEKIIKFFEYLTLFFPIFPFDPPENIRKPTGGTLHHT